MRLFKVGIISAALSINFLGCAVGFVENPPFEYATTIVYPYGFYYYAHPYYYDGYYYYPIWDGKYWVYRKYRYELKDWCGPALCYCPPPRDWYARCHHHHVGIRSRHQDFRESLSDLHPPRRYQRPEVDRCYYFPQFRQQQHFPRRSVQ